MAKIRVGIVGITGYTGEELLKILSRHSHAEVTVLAGRASSAPRALKDIYPHLSHVAVPVEGLNVESLAERTDVVFLALPHRVSFEIVPAIIAAGKKVVDLSADFRLRDAAVYEKWYGSKHTGAALLPRAVYGLSELYRDRIRTAQLVANPGCYPTTAVLGLAPAIKAGLIDISTIIVDSVSGISGAGRKKTTEYFAQEHPNFRPYNIAGGHRHTPEIEQELGALAGTPVTVTFTPHIVPVERGMVSTIYASLKGKVSTADILARYQEFYKGETFVRVLPEGKLPEMRNVVNTNLCEIGLKVDSRTGRLVVASAIDNLVKGASGQAVQNMNILSGLKETEGLL